MPCQWSLREDEGQATTITFLERWKSISLLLSAKRYCTAVLYSHTLNRQPVRKTFNGKTFSSNEEPTSHNNGIMSPSAPPNVAGGNATGFSESENVWNNLAISSDNQV